MTSSPNSKKRAIIGFTIFSFTKNLLVNGEESSDDEDDLTNKALLLLLQKGDKPIRIEGYVDNIVSTFNSTEFQSHFRMPYDAFDSILRVMTPILENQSDIPPKKQLLLAVIWLLATPDSYRSVGDRFDLAKSTLSVTFVRVIKGLCQISPNIIKWPNQEKINITKHKFQSFSKIPNAIGAIDGTYIAIKAPKENPESYINRKCFYVITLQGICDPHLQFIDCIVGYPSSVSDIRIFRNSHIYEDISHNQQHYFPNSEYILGDKAYPALPWLMPPYINRGNLTQKQIHFNMAIAKSRQVIERAFALLKGRFRRLKYLDMNRTDLIPATVLDACALHNICINHDDLLIDQYVNEGHQFDEHDLANDNEGFRDQDGRARDILADYLWQQH